MLVNNKVLRDTASVRLQCASDALWSDRQVRATVSISGDGDMVRELKKRVLTDPSAAYSLPGKIAAIKRIKSILSDDLEQILKDFNRSKLMACKRVVEALHDDRPYETWPS